jgi:DNA-binding transcriptional LysR family regulator
MDTLRSIRIFRQVVDSGSLSGAAERLDISVAMVSKHVMSIEQRLGVRLLNRTSRSLSLTEPGSVYFERCGSILDELQATELELGSQSGIPRGTLRITAPNLAAGRWLADLLAEFRHRYPQVLVEVSCEDRFVNLVEAGYDLALRIALSRDSLPGACIARPLRRTAFYLAASREYVERRGMPSTPEDLPEHDFIAVGNLLDSLPGLTSNTGASGPLRVVLRYRSMDGVANAVSAGIGIAPVPAALFEDPLFKDVMVPILPGYPLQQATLYALYVSRRFVPLQLRMFVDFIAESLGPVAAQEPRSHVEGRSVGPSPVTRITPRLGPSAEELYSRVSPDPIQQGDLLPASPPRRPPGAERRLSCNAPHCDGRRPGRDRI